MILPDIVFLCGNRSGHHSTKLINVRTCDWTTRRTHTPQKHSDEFRCSGRVNSSCSTNDTRRVTNEGGTRLWLRQTEHIRDHLYRCSVAVNQVLVAIAPLGIIGPQASFLAASIYQWHHDRTHKLCNIVPIEWYTPQCRCYRMLLHINGKFTMGKLK